MKEKEFIQELKERAGKFWPEGGPVFRYGVVPTVEYLTGRAQEMPSRVAINFYGREVTYRELDGLSNRVANFLLARGYRKGDFIGLYMPNCPQWAICYWGIVKMGGIAVSLNPMYLEKELSYQVGDAGIKAVFAHDQLYMMVEGLKAGSGIKDVIVTSFQDFLPEDPALPLIDAHKAPKKVFAGAYDLAEILSRYPSDGPGVKVDLDDPAYVCYTGGTTGVPKGCLHTHRSILAAAAVQSMGWRIAEKDIGLILTPMFLITTKSIVCDAMPFSGSSVVLLTRWDAKTFMMAADKYRPTWTWTARVDAQVEIMNHPEVGLYDLTSLSRSFTSPFGMSLKPEIRENWDRLTKGGVMCDFGYGMTENHATGALSLGLQDYDLQPRDGIFVGLSYTPVGPLGDFVMKIVDPATREILPFGAAGEIAQKSPTLCRGYLHKPEETARAFDSEGWFYTGDIGVIDGDGFLTIKGRSKELIKVSGMSVFPKEIEDMLTGLHPGVENAAVIGAPDPKTGEIPVAFVKLKEDYRGGLSAEDILQWCRENMSKVKVPRQVFIVEEIPLNSLGKVVKEELKKKLM